MAELQKIEERVTFALRDLYRRHGYAQFKMSKFEAYDLYMQNKEFLVSDGVITFTDTDGTLMALKPDVTLSIVKNYREEQLLQKVCYNENVYRISGASKTYREILQCGLECIGDVGSYEICEVVLLAAKSLQTISDRSVLDISHMDLAAAVLADMKLSETNLSQVYRCLSDKNEDELYRILTKEQADTLVALMRISGPISQMLSLLPDNLPQNAVKQLQMLEAVLRQAGLEKKVNLDFSIVSDRHYYNGIVFRGYVEGIPSEVLAGGQYDRLMERLDKQANGIGFAVYLDQLELLDSRTKAYDADTVILYDAEIDPLVLVKDAEVYSAEGVLLLKSLPKQLRYRRLLQYVDGRLQEIENNG